MEGLFDDPRRLGQVEMLVGVVNAVAFLLILGLLRAGTDLLWGPASLLIVALVYLMLYAMKRLDLLPDRDLWQELPLRRSFARIFGIFFTLGFGLFIFWEVWTPDPATPPGGYPPGYQPGPPWWFWGILVAVVVLSVVVVYLVIRWMDLPIPPREHLGARAGGMAGGAVAGVAIGWLSLSILGAEPFGSERVISALILSTGLGAGLLGLAYPNPLTGRFGRTWSIVLAVGSAALLGLGVAGIVPLVFEVPLAAAALGSAGMVAVGTIRHARHRDEPGSGQAEVE